MNDDITKSSTDRPEESIVPQNGESGDGQSLEVSSADTSGRKDVDASDETQMQKSQENPEKGETHEIPEDKNEISPEGGTKPSFKEMVTPQDEKKRFFEGDNYFLGVEKEIPAWALKFNNWRRNVMSEFLFLIWLAVIVGLLAGFAAHIFNRLITIVSDIFLTHISANRLNWWLIPVPVVGIVLAGIYTRYVIHTNLTHGVAQLMTDIYKGNYRLKRNLIYSPILGGAITLGLGGSAGSEGPIAYSGAAIGSNLGKLLGLQPAMVKVLIGCGAGAGISGIFLSPMGGLLFTLEFLRMELGTLSILACTLSCLVAYGIVFLCNGCIPFSIFTPDSPLDPSHYWAVVALGVFCGLYALYYSKVINLTDKFFIRIQNPWIRNIIGGLVIGICIFLFPALYGVGFPMVSDTIHQHYEELMEGNIFIGIHWGDWGMIIIAGFILLIKCWACGTCNASGGVSSDFAPTMYAGAVAGFFFAMVCNKLFHTHMPVGVFALIGMAGVMAGAIEAPLMTIFIILNMGMSFDYGLSIGICVLFSYVTVRVCSHLRGYDSKMVHHLQWFHDHKHSQGNPSESGLTYGSPDPSS